MSIVQSKRNFFYRRISVNSSSFPSRAQIEIPFLATHLILTNDSDTQPISFSFLNPDIDGELFKKEQPIAFDGISVNKVWFFRTGSKPVQVRVWAWRK